MFNRRISASSDPADSPDRDTANDGFVSRAQYERLRLDLKLKEADNRFLQEELRGKDDMLAMLTEGLKEVGS